MNYPEQADPALVREALERFGIDGRVRFLRKSQNYVYAIGADEWILRLSHGGYQSPEEIESELDWHAHLFGADVGVSEPLPSGAGKWVERLDGPDAVYSAAMYRFARGRELWPHAKPGDRDPEIHRNWGRLLGRLHRATASYQPAEGIVPRLAWNTEKVFGFAHGLTHLPHDLHDEWREQWAWLEALPQSEDVYGLTHNDPHHGNLRCDGYQPTLFDMGAAFFCWFAYDLAQPLYYSGSIFLGDEFGASPEQLAAMFDALIGGYREVRPIDDAWVARVASFIRVRRLQMCCAIYDQAGGPIEADWFVRNREAIDAREEPLA